ncbi:hypothetical protein JXB02_01330 [Candidatus Woesearchaeota archaeon]|nr:hypothetical protein [Candidatus Woesearchaeota archaeon]
MPSNQLLPKGYRSHLDLLETERAIKLVKDFFQTALARELGLRRVSAPRFVRKGSGVNDDLNGTERKVTFKVRYDGDADVEVVFSLAKWKRMALADYGFKEGEGLYTDMDAIRPDEEVLDNLHSVYVDQWDWEKIMAPDERTLDHLKATVRKIYSVMRQTEAFVHREYPAIVPALPAEIAFVHAEELEERFPRLSPREREDASCTTGNALRFFERHADPRIMVENVPPFSKGIVHMGTLPEEIRPFLDIGLGFNLDFNHAAENAVYRRLDVADLWRRFLALRPRHFHCSDVVLSTVREAGWDEEHLNFGEGTMDLAKVRELLPDDAWVTLETPGILERQKADIAFMRARDRRPQNLNTPHPPPVP